MRVKCARMHGIRTGSKSPSVGRCRATGAARGMIEDFETIKRVVHDQAVDLPIIKRSRFHRGIPPPNASRYGFGSASLRSCRPDEIVLWETANSCAVLSRGDSHDPSAR